ncbi:MAG: type II toxin-antitoxin system RelE/ParE family toxin [Ruminococcus sp.]|nr:type II toxin-antitoxin system RelE/ParE family toxin [Ruminococcus sp.]
MADKYEVTVTDKALNDMESIYYYISENLSSPISGMNQYNRIAQAIESLDVFPERTKLVDFEPERSMGFRQLLVDNYSVFYFVSNNKVIITNVIYSSSDIEKRLLDS